MSKPALEFYQTLKIAKTASQQQIKQSYKKLALKYHPDKNQDKETAKIKFRQISEAYSVLNNPEKRQIYDKYGMVDDQLNNFTQFQQFMGDFGFFQDFLQDFLMFDSMSQLEKMLNQVGGKNKKSKKKGGKRKKTTNSSTIPGMKKSQIQELQKLFGMMGSKDSFVDPEDLENLDDPQILQAMMAQMMMQQMMGGMQGNNMMQEMMQQMLGGKKTKKNKKQSSYKNDLDGQQFEDLQSDDGQLTQLQLKTLQFGQMNVQKKKVKKKNVYYCKFDSLKLKKEQILMHFTENHLNQVNKWIQKGCGKQQQKSQGFAKVSME